MLSGSERGGSHLWPQLLLRLSLVFHFSCFLGTAVFQLSSVTTLAPMMSPLCMESDQRDCGKSSSMLWLIRFVASVSSHCFPTVIWRQVWIFNTLGASAESVVVSSFGAFLPKAIESQFSVTASSASTLAGLVIIPGLYSSTTGYYWLGNNISYGRCCGRHFIWRVPRETIQMG